MNINCPEIDLAVKLSEDAGNKVSEISFGWSAVNKVIYMINPLQAQLKEQIQAEISTLKYRCYDGDPHNPPDEGFMCKKHSVCISFPKMRQYPR